MAERKTEADDQEISFIEPPSPDEVTIPEQKEHFALPARFGSIPLDEEPLGWVKETRPRQTQVTRFQHTLPHDTIAFSGSTKG